MTPALLLLLVALILFALAAFPATSASRVNLVALGLAFAAAALLVTEIPL